MRIGIDYPAQIPEDNLPCMRIKQIERLKRARAERKRAAATAGKGQGEVGRDHGVARSAARDRYRYHDSADKRPVGIQPVPLVKQPDEQHRHK